MSDVKKALELWVELTGIDPNATKYCFYDWNIRSINEELKESLILDDTQLTTLMLLECFTADYLEARSFSVNEMIQDYDIVLDYLRKSKELYSILNADEIIACKDDFKQTLLKALEHYGVTNPKVYELLESKEAVSFIRRDALKSLETLNLYQFSEGEYDKDKPKYVKKVHEFWNVNSLIKSLGNENHLSGVSLNLIRDPLDTSSYFVFTIKNGQNIMILTDKPKYAHPLQKHMTRRPDREMSRRIAKHHFPYSLLDIEFGSKGDSYRKYIQSTETVIYQDELYALKDIKDLEPEEVIWLVMMFGLIEKKYWKENHRAKEISYTADLIQEVKQIDTNEKNEMTLSSTLKLPKIKPEDISTQKMISEWDNKPSGKNTWLEKRYEHFVKEEVLNLTGNNKTIKLLTESQDIKNVTLEEYEETKRNSWYSDKEEIKELQFMDNTMFGTSDEIRFHKHWIARYNKALIIENEAEKEYKEYVDEIKRFYNERIKGNQEKLLSAIGQGDFNAPDIVYETFGHQKEYEMSNILSIGLEKERYVSSSSFSEIKWSQIDDSHNKYHCYLTGGMPAVFATFRPNTAEAVALMCNCKKEELPIFLQNWNKAELHSGNHLIQNIDPMEWACIDPWKALNLNLTVILSKSAYNQLRKNEGLPPNRLWNK